MPNDKITNENPLCTDYDEEGRCNGCGQFDCYECDWYDSEYDTMVAEAYISGMLDAPPPAPPPNKDEQELQALIYRRDELSAQIEYDTKSLNEIERKITAVVERMTGPQ